MEGGEQMWTPPIVATARGVDALVPTTIRVSFSGREGRRFLLGWEPITRVGHPDPHGPHGRNPRRLDVSIALSAVPPPEWARYVVGWYRQAHVNMPEEEPWAYPRVEGNEIRFAPLDDDLEGWVRGIDERITEANEFYVSTIAPQKAAEAEKRQAAEEETRRRMKEARRKAENL